MFEKLQKLLLASACLSIYLHGTIRCSIIFRMRNVSDKSCRENQNTQFMVTVQDYN